MRCNFSAIVKNFLQVKNLLQYYEKYMQEIFTASIWFFDVIIIFYYFILYLFFAPYLLRLPENSKTTMNAANRTMLQVIIEPLMASPV